MITLREGYDAIDWDSLLALYKATDGVIGLARAGNAERIQRAFKASYYILTAWEDDVIIGAVRMISDGECYGWVHDMAVHPRCQGKGVGKQLMQTLMDKHSSLLIGLTSSFEGIEFYKSLGFKKHKTGMAKYPGKSMYLEDD